MRMFTVMKGEMLKAIPWSIIEMMSRQATANHGQTLERLNERGGLCPSELYATLTGLRLSEVDHSSEANFKAEINIMRTVAASGSLSSEATEGGTPA